MLANWQAPQNVRVLTTTRLLGNSTAPYASFNLGLHVGDDRQVVLQNRALLATSAELPSEPKWLQQTHSTQIANIDSIDQQVEGDCDGAYTDAKGVVCAVMTADCLPLMLCDERGEQIAAVHVGWRGLADGVIEAALAYFSCAPKSVLAWTGPCIGPSAFEIGADVKSSLGGSSAAYKPSKNQDKWLANLPLLVEERLINLGVTQISHSGRCTFNEVDRFYSYRRDGVTGRIASLIWMD